MGQLWGSCGALTGRNVGQQKDEGEQRCSHRCTICGAEMCGAGICGAADLWGRDLWVPTYGAGIYGAGI